MSLHLHFEVLHQLPFGEHLKITGIESLRVYADDGTIEDHKSEAFREYDGSPLAAWNADATNAVMQCTDSCRWRCDVSYNLYDLLLFAYRERQSQPLTGVVELSVQYKYVIGSDGSGLRWENDLYARHHNVAFRFRVLRMATDASGLASELLILGLDGEPLSSNTNHITIRDTLMPNDSARYLYSIAVGESIPFLWPVLPGSQNEDRIVVLRFAVHNIFAGSLRNDANVRVYISGSNQSLGSWNSQQAIQMQSVAGDVLWTCELAVPLHQFPFEYKYIVMDIDGDDTGLVPETPGDPGVTCFWEDGANRRIDITDQLCTSDGDQQPYMIVYDGLVRHPGAETSPRCSIEEVYSVRRVSETRRFMLENTPLENGCSIRAYLQLLRHCHQFRNLIQQLILPSFPDRRPLMLLSALQRMFNDGTDSMTSFHSGSIASVSESESLFLDWFPQFCGNGQQRFDVSDFETAFFAALKTAATDFDDWILSQKSVDYTNNELLWSQIVALFAIELNEYQFNCDEDDIVLFNPILLNGTTATSLTAALFDYLGTHQIEETVLPLVLRISINWIEYNRTDSAALLSKSQPSVHFAVEPIIQFSESLRYILQCVLVHSGSDVNDGHFFVYVRRPPLNNDQCDGSDWVKIDDFSAHLIPQPFVVSVYGDSAFSANDRIVPYMALYVRESE